MTICDPVKSIISPPASDKKTLAALAARVRSNFCLHLFPNQPNAISALLIIAMLIIMIMLLIPLKINIVPPNNMKIV